MIDKPRIGYAALGSEKAHLHAPQRNLPIILLPGIAGSRLTDPVTGKMAWNPLGFPLGKDPGEFAADFDRLSQVSAELVPDEGHAFDDDDKRPEAISGLDVAPHVKHYYNVLNGVYGKFAKALLTLSTDTSPPLVRPRIYCCGYDWRQDNAKSAMRLAEVVEEALAETRERRVIIIAHSMGCLVARYYCRVLGGEAKVHRLYLIGAPTLGAPGAYLNLKHGLPGLYAKDIVEDTWKGDKAAILEEGIQMGSMVEGGILNAVSPGGGLIDKVTAFTGDLFIALSLGAGRLLSRDDTMRFARQIPALYQLIPGAVYCRENKNWIIFDPAATGLKPTGFMITLPSLFDILAEICGDGFKEFFRPGDAERNSPRANRNMHTLVQRVEAIGEADLKGKAIMIVELYERLTQAFVDCRSDRALYSDIYTGLLDHVELRAVCAGNLALAHRFDEALTVSPFPEKGMSPLSFLKSTVLGPILAPVLPSLPSSVADFITDDKKSKKEDKKRQKVRVYIPPRTVNVYSKMLPVDAGALIIPTEQLSDDDSNLVRWMLIPYALALPAILAMSKGSGFAAKTMEQAYGDGTVPTTSAYPDPGLLSNQFVGEFNSVSMSNHKDLACDDKVYEFIRGDIVKSVPEFLAT